MLTNPFRVYNIYHFTDSLACFVCHKEGHIAKDCTENNKTPHQISYDIEKTTPSSSFTITSGLSDHSKEENKISTPPPSKPPSNSSNIMPPPKLLTAPADITQPVIPKRPLSTSSNSELSMEVDTTKQTRQTDHNNTKTKPKKPRTEHDHNSRFILPLIIKKEISTNPGKYTLSSDQHQNLFDKASQSDTIKETTEARYKEGDRLWSIAWLMRLEK
ncbi:uncharacterized protein LOC141528036 isoform X1 [Cotesia typhae]|uniref:uncharacterized protein LOC141528036 isoform X1 n=1 Tax=Cotesia typhae TaxID=2053667 RepID=UPI003D6960B0